MKVYSAIHISFDWHIFEKYLGTYSSEREAVERIKQHHDSIDHYSSDVHLIHHTRSIEDRRCHDGGNPYYWICEQEVQGE